ncbi:polymorphic repeat outer membrane protein, putative [Trichomonas vaginalis G3]|uniref:Polymorphic repeat outer membrane protein, putative n=1 Tax=Trichomonas vaginalis (strain ATCC PRA-98 / G3) TaxID=412133 RepID=A2G4E7_TRIV3|nr:pectin lyase-like family [Trichomonas vaginalis G3]EAX87969.1 polymorphic repeat outer membrane protein, putative [Trichomonas vaginalis G3]KAI5547086.1 pectin lyase-like family [Trichomonas vaginalis G3]|eukprot:XP_001300899.1 polymorphic repeat outer membrane protein [Trichomonas vaginalis G3]
MFGFVLFSQCFSRDLRTLHVKESGLGDCISSACDFDTASHTLRNGDTVFFDQDKIEITSYPSAFSDLLHTAMFMNVTFISESGKTEINGRFMAGEQLFDIHSASRYCWARFVGFTFTHFEKKVLTRTMTENQWPLINFKECTFTENNDDIIDVNGGTFQFDNCLFTSNRKRPIKAVKEAMIECNDCKFTKSESCFFSDCDVILNNCQFTDNFGSRGGAIYAASATLTIRGCKFIRNTARINGGAIYTRLSISDLASDIKDCVFISNTARENGTAVYTYLSDMLLENNCFSGDESSEYVQNQSNNKLVNNEFKSQCTKQLEYEPPRDDYAPLEPNPKYDIDVDVGPNVGIEL